MPTYGFQCKNCGEEKEMFRSIAKMNDDLPECCGEVMERKIFASYVVADIQPYKAMAIDQRTGTVPTITSLSEHREFLKANGLVEVGNEMPKPRKPQAIDVVSREELTQVTREVLRKTQ
jgi:putative FmdB family regulatory protein